MKKRIVCVYIMKCDILPHNGPTCVSRRGYAGTWKRGVLSISRISIRRIPIIGLGLGLWIGLGIGLGLGIGFGELKFGELKRNREKRWRFEPPLRNFVYTIVYHGFTYLFVLFIIAHNDKTEEVLTTGTTGCSGPSPQFTTSNRACPSLPVAAIGKVGLPSVSGDYVGAADTF